jgi:hypothetical protein
MGELQLDLPKVQFHGETKAENRGRRNVVLHSQDPEGCGSKTPPSLVQRLSVAISVLTFCLLAAGYLSIGAGSALSASLPVVFLSGAFSTFHRGAY